MATESLTVGDRATVLCLEVREVVEGDEHTVRCRVERCVLEGGSSRQVLWLASADVGAGWVYRWPVKSLAAALSQLASALEDARELVAGRPPCFSGGAL